MANNNEHAFRERFEKAVEKAGGATELAKKTGLSRGVIYKYLSGESDPSRSRLVTIAKEAEVSLQWLAAGEGPMGYDQPLSRLRTPHPVEMAERPLRPYGEKIAESFATIPLYKSAVAAGHGLVFDSDGGPGFVPINEEWLWRAHHRRPQELVAFPVAGDSMEPVLQQGDILLVDRTEEGRGPGDGIFVIRLDDDLLVKRLQRLPGNTLKIVSENPRYETFEIDLNKPKGFEPIGRVIGVLSLRLP